MNPQQARATPAEAAAFRKKVQDILTKAKEEKQASLQFNCERGDCHPSQAWVTPDSIARLGNEKWPTATFTPASSSADGSAEVTSRAIVTAMDCDTGYAPTPPWQAPTQPVPTPPWQLPRESSTTDSWYW